MFAGPGDGNKTQKNKTPKDQLVKGTSMITPGTIADNFGVQCYRSDDWCYSVCFYTDGTYHVKIYNLKSQNKPSGTNPNSEPEHHVDMEFTAGSYETHGITTDFYDVKDVRYY